MNDYHNLVWSFFKIGLFGFGGGYAMLPLIQREVVEINNWCSYQGFTDIVAISQITPGPIVLNAATFLGFTVTSSILGAVLATFAVCLPPFVLMLILCYYFRDLKNNPRFNNALALLRPAVIGFVAAAALSLINTNNFSDWKSALIFLPVFAVSVKSSLHPIYYIALSGLAGYLLY